MSLARAMRRGAALNARFAVNGSQKASRSFGMAVARCAPTDGMARSPLLALARRCARWRLLGSQPRPLPLREAAATTREPAMQDNNGRQARQNQQAQGAPAARSRRSRRRGNRGGAAQARQDPRGLRALRLRATGDAGHRIYRRTRQISSRSGSAQRGVFSFQDDDEQWLSLRYDLTAPLARYVAENFESLPKPYRSYRFGYVYRNEKPGPGRFRQFMQFDADTVGSASPAADAEVCMMIADTMEELGIPRGSYVVKVNNRKVLDGIMESIELHGESTTAKRLIVLRAIDKMDRLGRDGVG